MAFGNAVGQGFVNPEEIIVNEVIIEGDNGLLLVYSGSAAFGNLIGSIAGASGVDQFGNYYVEGVAAYAPNDSALNVAVALQSGDVQFFSSNTEAGPWTAEGAVILAANGTISIFSGLDGITDTASNFFVPSGANGGFCLSNSGRDGNSYDMTRLTIATQTPETLDSTTPVTLFEFEVSADTQYEFSYEIPLAANGTGTPRLRFSSVAAVVSTFQAETVLDGGTAAGFTAFQTALNTFSTVGPALVSGDNYVLRGSGFVIFTTGGIIDFEIGATAAVAMAIVPAGARFRLMPVTS